jgi:hypothetical protein
MRLVLVPLASETDEGEIAMLVKTAGVTTTLIDGALMPFNEANTLVPPTVVASTVPELAPTLAVAGATDVQLTCDVRLAVLPSE